MLALFKTLNLALAFFLELCLLAAFGYWGFQVRQGLFVRILTGIGLPVLVAVLWGVFLSPKAVVSLALPVKMCCKAVLFGTAVAMLYSTGRTALAISFGAATTINFLFIIIWKQ